MFETKADTTIQNPPATTEVVVDQTLTQSIELNQTPPPQPEYTKQQIQEMKKNADIKNLELITVEADQPFPQEEVDTFISNFIVDNGGTLAELFVKLPPETSPQVLEYIKRERQAQVDYLNDYLQLFDVDNDLFKNESDSQGQELRKELLTSGFFEYAQRFKEVRSLMESIPSTHKQEFQELTSEAISLREQSQIELTNNISQAIDNVIDPNLNHEPITSESLSTNLEKVSVSRETTPPQIIAVDSQTKEKKSFSVMDAVSDILPFLIAVDSALAFAKGGRPQLMTFLREIDEVRNGPKSNEQILASFDISPLALELLQKDKVSDAFFKLFVGKEEELMDFFDRMNPNNGNMLLFLEKLSRPDIRAMVQEKKLPAGIKIDDEDLELILSKLRSHERIKLGIHPQEPKMR